ncbi:hypothetical protein CPB86DRAFT_810397 [Serendipita vermifera]|nr:hypothetical protein CPB86DRAFT_810397 [Serendipita vermifera]
MKPPIITPEDDHLTGGLSGFGVISNWWTRPKHPPTISRHATYKFQQSGYGTEPRERSRWQRYVESYHRRYQDLLPLRLINRTFYDICTPYVFHELTLVDPPDDRTIEIAEKYGMHMRILRISLENWDVSFEKGRQKLERMMAIVRLCPAIQTLAIYHVPDNMDGRRYRGSLTHLMEPFIVPYQYTNLDTIGIYFPHRRDICPEHQRRTIQYQMKKLANSERARKLKRLIISLHFLSKDDLEPIRTKFTGLERLAINEHFWEIF